MKLQKFNFILGPFLFAQMAYSAVTPQLLRNNKEIVSEVIDQKSVLKIIKKIKDPQYMSKVDSIFNESLVDFNRNSKICDLGMIDAIDAEVKSSSLGITTDEFLQILRMHDRIDDIFLKINQRALNVRNELAEAFDNRVPMNLHNDQDLIDKWDFKGLYSEFNQFPNDRSNCSTGAWFRIISKVGDDLNLLGRMNLTALKLGVVSKENFLKLEVLRKADLPEWDLFLFKYLDIATYAKDKLITRPTIGLPTDYTQDKVKIARWKKLSRREALYKKFDSTQIMMLGETLVTTSKRMMAKNVRIVFDYDTPTPEQENYVVDAQTQYCMCLSLLAKDVTRANATSVYEGKPISYDDIVMASVETGAVNFEELEQVIGFEGFWNFKQPAWKVWTSYLMQFTTSASYFLPAPYNIIGAVGLSVISAKVNQLGPKQECTNTRI